MVLCILLSMSDANTWSAKITTNSTQWHIERQSSNLRALVIGEASGNITSADVTPGGRKVNGFFSRYAKFNANDVSAIQRTSADNGIINYAEVIGLQSSVVGNITDTLDKPASSPIFHFEYTEDWPAYFGSRRQISYKGSNINDLDFAGNNMDFVENNILHNKEYSKDTIVHMVLTGMNATVLARDEGIISAEFKPTKRLDYNTTMHTSGIAELSYRMTGTDYDPKRDIYLPLAEGDERYYGTYNISRNIKMNSIFYDNDNLPFDYYENLPNYVRGGDDWMPCCSGGYLALPTSYKKDFGSNVEDVFDCTCYKSTSAHQS